MVQNRSIETGKENDIRLYRKQKQDGRARIFFRNKVGKLKTPRGGWV